jgi:hypothetical protein
MSSMFGRLMSKVGVDTAAIALLCVGVVGLLWVVKVPGGVVVDLAVDARGTRLETIGGGPHIKWKGVSLARASFDDVDAVEGTLREVLKPRASGGWIHVSGDHIELTELELEPGGDLYIVADSDGPVRASFTGRLTAHLELTGRATISIGSQPGDQGRTSRRQIGWPESLVVRTSGAPAQAATIVPRAGEEWRPGSVRAARLLFVAAVPMQNPRDPAFAPSTIGGTIHTGSGAITGVGPDEALALANIDGGLAITAFGPTIRVALRGTAGNIRHGMEGHEQTLNPDSVLEYLYKSPLARLYGAAVGLGAILWRAWRFLRRSLHARS